MLPEGVLRGGCVARGCAERWVRYQKVCGEVGVLPEGVSRGGCVARGCVEK